MFWLKVDCFWRILLINSMNKYIVWANSVLDSFCRFFCKEFLMGNLLPGLARTNGMLWLTDRDKSNQDSTKLYWSTLTNSSQDNMSYPNIYNELYLRFLQFNEPVPNFLQRFFNGHVQKKAIKLSRNFLLVDSHSVSHCILWLSRLRAICCWRVAINQNQDGAGLCLSALTKSSQDTISRLGHIRSIS